MYDIWIYLGESENGGLSPKVVMLQGKIGDQPSIFVGFPFKPDPFIDDLTINTVGPNAPMAFLLPC
jgi:hypothetical protein